MKDVLIRRGLVSVSDKEKLSTVITPLAMDGVQFLSTGGTLRTLVEANVGAIDVSTYTGFPEMMDGRLKTLHPKVHGGLLGVLDNSEHARLMGEHGIEAINLLIVNFYPFEKKVAEGVPHKEIVENIDIGGPAMVRSAAKNYEYLTVLTHPSQYPTFLSEYEKGKGKVSFDLREYLAKEAFKVVAQYDQAIAEYFVKYRMKKNEYRKHE